MKWHTHLMLDSWSEMVADSGHGIPRGGTLTHARRARAHVTQRLHGWAFLPALAFVAIALTLLADGDTVLGWTGVALAIPVTWLSGIWVRPWGDDAYALAMRDVLRMLPLEADHINRRRQEQMRLMIRNLSERDSPRDLVGPHRDILRCMREIYDVDVAYDGPLDERAVCLYEKRLELLRLCDELKTEPEGQYVLVLRRGVDDFIDAAGSGKDRLEGPLQRSTEKLLKVRPPRRWRETHHKLVAQFGEYFGAVHNYYVSLEGGDLGAIRHAARDAAMRHEEVSRIAGEYVKELGKSYSGTRAGT